MRNDQLAKFIFFFFNDTATTEIYTLSLHDALPICEQSGNVDPIRQRFLYDSHARPRRGEGCLGLEYLERDRKSTRLNSSHLVISYAVFCLKKKNHSVISPTRVKHDTIMSTLDLHTH